MTIHHEKPAGFTHGLNFSQLLSVLVDDARLAKSARTKAGLRVVWVGEEGDSTTRDRYAGPEKLGGVWIQVFLIVKTWALRKSEGQTTYRRF